MHLEENYGIAIYRPSKKLAKVNKVRIAKGTSTEIEVGVVEVEGRALDLMNSMVTANNSSKEVFTVMPVWIGWTVCGKIVDDSWIINKYGLLPLDL